MAGNLQYRLYNASIPPPGDAWSKIAEELDKDPEQRLVTRMQEATLTPPPSAWQNILDALNEADHTKAKVVPFRRKWRNIAAAAIVTGIVLLSGLNYFMADKDSSGNSTTKTSRADGQKTNASTDKNIVPPTPVTSNDPGTQPAPVAIVNNASPRPIAVAALGFSPRIRYSRVKPAPADSEVNTDGAVGGSASLKPEAFVGPQDYFTVTAPNGQPARISARFADAVNYVMVNAPTDNMTNALKSFSWKQRVSKWCDKLMMNAAFIPAGTNFMDIIELQELLNE